eukprot:2635298-Prymnesium_polylepis.2
MCFCDSASSYRNRRDILRRTFVWMTIEAASRFCTLCFSALKAESCSRAVSRSLVVKSSCVRRAASSCIAAGATTVATLAGAALTNRSWQASARLVGAGACDNAVWSISPQLLWSCSAEIPGSEARGAASGSVLGWACCTGVSSSPGWAPMTKKSWRVVSSPSFAAMR